jgi:cell division protein FtsL
MYYQRTQNYSSRRQQNWSRNQNTVAFASTIKLGPVTHTVLVALMITVLGLIYLTQATKVTSYDYATQKIDSQIAELSSQKSDLEIENARLTALETVKESSVAAAMSKPVTTDYVQQ